MGAQKTRRSGKRGLFITFEGGEGAGKSTQIDMLEKALRKKGLDVMVTREPGGSPGAEAIRHVLLSGAAEPLGAEMEAILFSAARSDHVESIIRPALEKGTTVLCDRFFDSTRVYQGATGEVPMELLHQLERVACEDCWPDLTIILDIDPAEGMRRAGERRGDEDKPDRFEKESMQLQQQRREAYLAIAKDEPERCQIVDASGEAKDVHKQILDIVLEKLGPLPKPAKPAKKRSKAKA